MATLQDRVFDNGLTVLTDEADQILITSAEATTYTQAVATFAIGNSNTISISDPQDRPGGGRRVVVSAIIDGSVTAAGTATHFALVDTVNSRLLATGPLTSSSVVVLGNTFTLTSTNIGISDPS